MVPSVASRILLPRALLPRRERCSSLARQGAVVILSGWVFVLIISFSEMGGGGTLTVITQASTEQLCKAARRAFWSQLQGAKGSLTTCKLMTPDDQALPTVE